MNVSIYDFAYICIIACYSAVFETPVSCSNLSIQIHHPSAVEPAYMIMTITLPGGSALLVITDLEKQPSPASFVVVQPEKEL